MWLKEYKDIPTDTPLKKERREPGKGIIGCEMHDIAGWGETFAKKPEKKGFFYQLLERL